jgi:hypothetical protein
MNHIDPNILVAIITGCFSLIAALFSIYMSNRLISYKIEELRKKVEKHNNVVERTTLLEHDMQTVWSRYDDMKGRMDSIEQSQNEQYQKILELLERRNYD